MLEIGPYVNSVFKGEMVKYFDIISREDLIKQAKEMDEKLRWNTKYKLYLQISRPYYN